MTINIFLIDFFYYRMKHDPGNPLWEDWELDVPDILSNQVMEIMKSLKADGKAKDDHGGIVQYYEKLAKVKVRKK